jgi:hypothetical protein
MAAASNPSWVSIGWRHGNDRNKEENKLTNLNNSARNDGSRISSSGRIAVTMMKRLLTPVASIEKPIIEHGNNRNSVTSNEGNDNINLIIIIHNSNDDERIIDPNNDTGERMATTIVVVQEINMRAMRIATDGEMMTGRGAVEMITDRGAVLLLEIDMIIVLIEGKSTTACHHPPRMLR